MVLEIFLIILTLAATALCIYVIISLRKILQQMDVMQKDFKQLIDSSIPVLNNLNEVASRANRIVSGAEHYWDEIDNSIKNLKEKVSNMTSLTRFRDAENPVKDLIKNLRALFKGASAFWSEFKNR